ncbi:MAG: rhomboid family intramembrane serine protease [Bacteroidetes bacterium]|nr:rhomboid family intramembrane serine protease [Bacteroidota bacterium]
MSITIIIIAITCIVSFIGFSNQNLIDDLIFYPPAITNRKQWYRFITCGFIHADITHLAFNMYSFYMFGDAIENGFSSIYGNLGKLMYVLIYITSLFVCLLPTYLKHKDDYHYKSLGASGAVSAIVFAFIFLSPLSDISLIILPIPAPAFLFGFVYLGITYYLSKRGNSYINHSAHFWGAVYGIAFLIVTSFLLTDFNALTNFTMQVQQYLKAKF